MFWGVRGDLDVLICIDWCRIVNVVGRCACMSFFAAAQPGNFVRSKECWHRIDQTVWWFYQTVWCQNLCYLRTPGSVGLLNGREDFLTRKSGPNKFLELTDFTGKALVRCPVACWS